ncbi:MAG: type IV secretion system protein VirD4 [Mesorhizobium sp.]|uniref:type IV secretion system ATPase VirD4 n=1 Tax=Mesorhizobium sp. TaxID=1871066 RepID=UPI000FEA8913|nr:MAG: type IV secretion system protein VirD4 [Mesorhizobium sp.]RWP25909.1 MAG: type IV secretion system protein VirD4 [Mesorhizobium sp.]RWP42363.1 MAG: type IV secretion system protein VirD4 [Mesorhizobium sp.]
MDSRQKTGTVLLGGAFSLVAGLFLASAYANFQHGVTSQAIQGFDILAFWYETPFYNGDVRPVFYHGLLITGFTVAVTLFILAIVVFKPQHHGTARWARFSEMKKAGYIMSYQRVSGPIFGKTIGPRLPGQYLSNGEQPHSLVVAPTRAGKGVGVVIPTLLTFNGSVLALDVKGELFELTSRARKARGDRIFKFAPMDRAARTHSYNPVLDIVSMPPERQFSEARRLAHNLIAPKGKGSEGFIDGARDLFVAGILACIERGTPSIGAVYDLFTLPGEKYKLFAQLAEECQSSEARRIFDNMAGNDTKILTSYTSVLSDGGLNLWADPLIKAATTTSDFSIYDLRRDPTTIYLCVSPNDLEVIAPLVRLFFQQVVSVMQRTMPTKDEIFEVLFLLDEFKHLGKLEAVETAVTTIAGYKGRFMFIIQSLSALTGAYEQSGKENFLSNTGVQVFMATADDETPAYISKSIGDYTFRAKSKSFSQSRMLDANIQFSEQGANLLRPEQVRLIDENSEIVLIKGRPPMLIHKVKYYSDRTLSRIFESQTGPLPEPEPIGHCGAPPEPPPPFAHERHQAGDAGGAADHAFGVGQANHFATDDVDVGQAEKYYDVADHYSEEYRLEHRADEAALDERSKHRLVHESIDKQWVEKEGEDDGLKGVQAPPAAQPVPEPEEDHALSPQRELLDRIIALQERNIGHSSCENGAQTR